MWWVYVFARSREDAYSGGMKRLSVIAIVFLAFGGLADSFYLAQHEASGTPLLCAIKNLSGCNIVASSKYSHFFGISLAELGVLFYGFLFICATLELIIFNRVLRRILQALAIIGLLFSALSTFTQVFVIQALCIYCLASGAITIFIFILATGIEPLFRRSYQTVSTITSTPDASSDKLPMPPV